MADLGALDPGGGPAPGEHNFFRGVPLAERDATTRAAIAEVGEAFGTSRLVAAWEEALGTPSAVGPGRWVHGDLHGANLLVHHGRLCAVVDFDALGVGDPACDAMAAWTFVPAGVRRAFRDAAGTEDDAWSRGRGWALSFGLVALPYYRRTNPSLAAVARRAVEAVLADVDRRG